MRELQRLAAIGLLLLIPSAALAQASIAGTVRDPSGAVLPGVVVEASSPALIERIRSATTDGTGQYKVVDLRPGVYSVTFTLTGFSTLRRENIDLTGSTTASVDAELTVGNVSETLTVSARAPSVDVQNTAKATVITEDTASALATGRSQYGYAVLIPGVTQTSFNGGNIQDVGGAGNMALAFFTVHGNRPFDQRLMINGLTSRNLLSSGWGSNFVPDMGAASEVTMQYSSGTAEAYGSGFTINLIPREGSNVYRGTFFASGVHCGSHADFTCAWQANNYSADLQAQGLSSPNRLKALYDYNPSGGGPILKNRVWFFASMRWQESTFYYAGAYENANLGNPNAWNYVPDLRKPGEDSRVMDPTGSVRITVQASPRNKFGFSTDPQSRYWRAAGPNQAPEVYSSWSFQHETFTTVTYSSPITNKLLLDARFGHFAEGFVDDCAPTVNPACAGKSNSSQQFTDAITVLDNNTGLTYHGNGYCCVQILGIFSALDEPHKMQAHAALSYVSGAHALKIGWQDEFATSTVCNYDNPAALSYQFGTPANGETHVDEFGRSLVPVSLEMHAMPFCATTRLSAEMGVYAQDKWTFGRATVNGGLRFDYYKTHFPAQHLGPTRWTPTRDFTIPAEHHYDLKDLTPRVGVSYDLTGNGKTAVKAAWGKYMSGINPGDGNPVFNLAVNNDRSWTPSLPFGAPNYYTPQCDLLNPAANGDCGPSSNVLFGQVTPTAAVDPATYTGWGHRFWNQEVSAGIQREVAPRVSVDFSYYRRWYGNFQVVQNRATTATDYIPYTLQVPIDPRVPMSGQTLGGFYEVDPAKAGLVDNYTTFADRFGREWEHWNGWDLTVNARPRRGFTVQGGISAGRRSSDTCEIMQQLPEVQLVFGVFAVPRSDCHLDEAWQTQVKALGTYLIPRIDVQFGVTFQSAPGPPLAANFFVVPGIPGQPGLPGSFSGGGFRLINLLPILQPQAFFTATAPVSDGSTEYIHRANQVDVRLSKIFRVGHRYRVSINLDLNNLLNANYVLLANNTYGPFWQAPLNIMDARLFKLGGQFDF